MAAWRAGGGGDDGGLHCLVAGSHHGLFWHLGPICGRENAELEQGKTGHRENLEEKMFWSVYCSWARLLSSAGAAETESDPRCVGVLWPVSGWRKMKYGSWESPMPDHNLTVIATILRIITVITARGRQHINSNSFQNHFRALIIK